MALIMTDVLVMHLSFVSRALRRAVFKAVATAFLAGIFSSLSATAVRGSSTIADCPSEVSASTKQHAVCVPRLDDVWLVSTRNLGCPDCETSPLPQVWRYDCNAHEWNAASRDAFLASQDPSAPTVFWIHGNRIEQGEAQSQGLNVYRRLTLGVSGDRPIHFVIFSWPSSPIRGLKEDARVKARRTNIDGYYLADLINQIDSKVRVDIIGYSFGARIATGALHVLGGGALFGRVLTEPVKPRAPMDAVLIAPAVNNDWLAIGRPHERALSVVDQMISFNNTCDRALKRYGVIDPCTRPEALGYTFAVGPLGENGRKLRQLDMCCVVGKQHNWANYFYNPGIVAQMRPYVGLQD